MVPGKTATAMFVDAQQDRGRDRVGDQPSPRVRSTQAAEPGALASDTFDAGRLERVAVTETQVPRICAKKKPNE